MGFWGTRTQPQNEFKSRGKIFSSFFAQVLLYLMIFQCLASTQMKQELKKPWVNFFYWNSGYFRTWSITFKSSRLGFLYCICSKKSVITSRSPCPKNDNYSRLCHSHLSFNHYGVSLNIVMKYIRWCLLCVVFGCCSNFESLNYHYQIKWMTKTGICTILLRLSADMRVHWSKVPIRFYGKNYI